MKNTARRTLALGLCLSTMISMSPMTAQAFSGENEDGIISYSNDSYYVVRKGEDVTLSVLASTSDGHDITYQWDEGNTDEGAQEDSGSTDAGTSAEYQVKNVTSNRELSCKITCGNHSTAWAYVSVYVAEELKVDQPITITCDKAANAYQDDYFLFTPSETGDYIFLSDGTAASSLCVFEGMSFSDDSRTLGCDSFYSQENNNYGGKAIVRLTEGQTYVIRTIVGPEEAGTYSVSVQSYVPTELSLRADKREYNVDDKTASTTMSVTASTANDDAFLQNVTYQWYVYDPIKDQNVLMTKEHGTSITVQNSSVNWRSTTYRCIATDQYGETAQCEFSLENNTDWNAYPDQDRIRVSYNTAVTLKVNTFMRESENPAELSYQWYRQERSESGDSQYVLIQGAESTEYTTEPLTSSTYYLCVATDKRYGISIGVVYCAYQKLMDVSVDQTYYEVDANASLSVPVHAEKLYNDVNVQYFWYQTDSASGSETELEDRKNSAIDLEAVTETQVLRCEVYANRFVDGYEISDRVNIYFVVDPGTGYSYSYTTSDDEDVAGASPAGLGKYLGGDKDTDPAQEHSLTRTEAKAATCTEAGNIEYWTCTECEKLFRNESGEAEMDSTEAVIPARGHSLMHIAAKEATVTETGNKEYWKCTTCGKLFGDEAGKVPTTRDKVTIPVRESASDVIPDDEAPEADTTAAKAETSTTTTTNTDGSVTTTTIDADGTQTKVTTSEEKNGSVKIVTKVENPDGSTTSSTMTKNADGSSKESIVEKSADGKLTKTTVNTQADGSATRKVNTAEINSAGKSVDLTVTTKTDSKGKVTEITEKSVIDNAAANTSATVTVKKDGDGNVTSAAASVQTIVSGNKSTITASMLAQIAEAAGITLKGSFFKGSSLGTLAAAGNMVNSVDITVNVTDSDGSTKYKLIVNTADLVAGNVLHLYKYSTKTGIYKAVNSKKYTVRADGGISVSAADKATYKLVSDTEAKEATSQIKATYAAKKTAVTLKTGKTTSFALKKGADQSSIQNITYTSSNKKVAAVSKKGKITAKAAGKTTVSAKINLKNGKTKTVKMKVNVK